MLHDNLKGRKVAVPDFVWDNVAKGIGEKKKRRGFFWIWGSGLSVLLLLSAYVLWSNNGFTNSNVPCYLPSLESANANYLFDKYVVNENELINYEMSNENLALFNDTEYSESQDELVNNDNNANSIFVNQEQDLQGNDEQSLNATVASNRIVSENISQQENGTDVSLGNQNQDVETTDDNNVMNDPKNSTNESDNLISNERPDDLLENHQENNNTDSNNSNTNVIASNLSEDDVIVVDSIVGNNAVDQTSLNYVEDLNELSNNNPTTDSESENLLDTNLNESNEAIQNLDESTIANSRVDSSSQLSETNNEKNSFTDTTLVDDTVYVSISNNPQIDTLALPAAKESKWIIGLNGGYSAYDIAVFNEVFHSGALSNRFFEASGIDLNFHASYELSNRFQLFASLNYNKKSTNFNYAVRTDDEGYNEHIINGNPLPIPEINDADASSNCYLIEDVIANYNIQTVFLDLGFQYNFIQRPKLTVGSGLFVGADLSSNLKLNEPSILAVTNTTANLSTIKYGLGLEANYWLTKRFAVSLAPKFQLLSSATDHAFYAGVVKEWITNVGLKYKF